MKEFDLTRLGTKVYFRACRNARYFDAREASPMKDLTRKLLLAVIPVLVLAGTFSAASTPVKANKAGHLTAAPMPLCPRCWPGATK